MNIPLQYIAHLIKYVIILSSLLSSALKFVTASSPSGESEESEASYDSIKSRATAALATHATQPPNPLISRKHFPAPASVKPQICLAFLSCCGRTDLLNHTLAGAIRHMEEDEPEGLHYEIAWVDNGSGEEKTNYIENHFQIDHALPLAENKGLAYGMNLLIFNLCTAPYILLLEEDWLYTDSSVAIQTPQRKRVISTAMALTETNVFSYDGRLVMGAFLRSDRYDEFLLKPNIGDWAHMTVDLNSVLVPSMSHDCLENQSEKSNCDDKNILMVPVDYQIFCGEKSLSKVSEAYGSYTNGSGLYKREHLHKIGRIYGEPGDLFNFRYAEPNYAFRAMQNYCHVAIRLDYDEENMKLCKEIGGKKCTAAFNHIGAGRGTFPMDVKSAKCVGLEWMIHGVEKYDNIRMQLMMKRDPSKCDRDEVIDFTRRQNFDSQRHQKSVAQKNEAVFKLELEQRNLMRNQATTLRNFPPEAIRQANSFFQDMSREEMLKYADDLEAKAESPHPIEGFWDSHGFPMIQVKNENSS